MSDDKMFREPDERSGPALADREPVVLPEQRKKAASRVKETTRKLKDKLGF